MFEKVHLNLVIENLQIANYFALENFYIIQKHKSPAKHLPTYSDSKQPCNSKLFMLPKNLLLPGLTVIYHFEATIYSFPKRN